MVFGDAFERGVDEITEDFAVVKWQVEHVGDDRRRNMFGILISCIKNIGITEIVDECVAKSARLGFHRGNFLRSKSRQQHAASVMMKRRIRGNRWRATVWATLASWLDSLDHHIFRTEMFGVISDCTHVFMAHGQPRAAVTRRVGYGATVAQFLPDLGGIGVVGRVQVVEVGGPVGDRINECLEVGVAVVSLGHVCSLSRKKSTTRRTPSA